MIAVMGGSFDPIHIGHLRVAIEVRDHLHVDQLRLIPCGQPPHKKQTIATAEQRLQMLALAVDDEQSLMIHDREIRRDRTSYTVDTLADLRAQSGQQPMCLIVGADAYQQLNGWHQWQRLFELAHLIVVQRPGYTIEANTEVADYTINRSIDAPHQLTQHSAGSLYFMQIPPLKISSTRIRALALDGKNYRYLVPDKVYQWMQQQQIYQAS
jgi:nicotinate-nucleotide adenylyltransferase